MFARLLNTKHLIQSCLGIIVHPSYTITPYPEVYV